MLSMKNIILCVIPILFSFTIVSGVKVDRVLEVEITNFHKKASDCGIALYTSLYKAKIVNHYGFEQNVFLYFQCAEGISRLKSTIEIEVSDYIPSSGIVCDFTDLKDSEKKIMPKYSVTKMRIGTLYNN